MTTKTTPFLGIHLYWDYLREVELHSSVSAVYHSISLFRQLVTYFTQRHLQKFRNYSPEKHSPIQFLSSSMP